MEVKTKDKVNAVDIHINIHILKLKLKLLADVTNILKLNFNSDEMYDVIFKLGLYSHYFYVKVQL